MAGSTKIHVPLENREPRTKSESLASALSKNPSSPSLKRSRSQEPLANKKTKKTRKRNTEDRRTKHKRRNWANDEINRLLDFCIDLHNNDELFEKPSARVYYEKVQQSLQFENCDRQSINNKMRHLKISYRQALKFKREEKRKEDYDKKICKKTMIKTCKFFNKLRVLMPKGTEGEAIDFDQSFDTTMEDLEDDEGEMSAWNGYEEEDESIYSPEVIIHQRDDDEVDLNISSLSTQFALTPTEKPTETFLETIELPERPNHTDSHNKKSGMKDGENDGLEIQVKNKGNKDPIAIKHLSIEERRLKMEERKLALEERRLALEEKRLNLEVSKIQFEKSTFNDELALQREKLAVQKENEIKRFELQLDATLKLEMAKLELSAYKKYYAKFSTNEEDEIEDKEQYLEDKIPEHPDETSDVVTNNVSLNGLIGKEKNSDDTETL